MKTIFEIFVFVAVSAIASATKKGDDTLLSVLSKEREEIKDMFRRENKELRRENKELRQESTKLQQEDEELRKMNQQLQEQIVKLRDEKLQDEIARQKKEIQKLRHNDRRRQSSEKKLQDSIRQANVLETKKCKCQTSNSSQTEAIAEVAFINGSAHATSDAGGSYGPAKAFIVGNKENFWRTNSDTKNWGVFPQMIWYDFSIGNGFVPARITFQSAQNSDSYIKYTPSIWEFVGSNDDVCSKSGNWTILCRDYSDVQPRNIFAIKRCDVEGRAEKKFRCLGINILSTHHQYSAVSNIRMWQKV